MTAKTFLIIHPKARQKHQKRFAQLTEVLKHTPYDSAESQNAEDITLLCKKALEAGYTKILAVGGDGTLSLCIQAFMNNQINVYPEATLTPLPFGTGNDFHSGSKSETTTKISLGHFKTKEGKDHYFANSFSAGITPSLIKNYASSKLRSYLFATLKTLISYKSQNIHVNQTSKPTLIFLITKGPYVGGGMRFHSEANHITGKAKVVWIPRLSAAKILRNILRIYSGGIETVKEVECMDFQNLTLSFDTPTNQVEADGELIEVSQDVPIKLIPNCINILHLPIKFV